MKECDLIKKVNTALAEAGAEVKLSFHRKTFIYQIYEKAHVATAYITVGNCKVAHGSKVATMVSTAFLAALFYFIDT